MANFTMYDREREFKWQIECKLSGGTYAYIDAEDIYSGRLTRQISSGEGIEIGSCYVSELDLTIVASALPSNVVSVKPYFRLLTSTEIVDDVVQKYYTGYNLGVFKIASTKRKEYGRIDLVCYDKMADLDALILSAAYTELLASDWKPFYLLDWIATKVGVTYTFTQASIEAMPNGTLYFKLAEETSNIKTYRDLLQYVCMLIGAYGIFDEDGNLNIKTFADTSPYSLPASFRFSESFGDVPIVYSGVELTVKNVTTMFGNANNTVVMLSDNPFLYSLSTLNQTTDYATFIMNFLRNIYTEFQGLSYYAGEFEIPPDASLNVGRLLAVSGGGAASTINCFLQKIDVNFDGRMMLSCGNPNTYVTRTQNRTTTSITNLTSRIETLENASGSGSASSVTYDNTTSGLSASNVQSAIDEIAQDFQDGCDIITQAVTAKGQTPASNSPSDIAYAISRIPTDYPRLQKVYSVYTDPIETTIITDTGQYFVIAVMTSKPGVTTSSTDIVYFNGETTGRQTAVYIINCKAGDTISIKMNNFSGNAYRGTAACILRNVGATVTSAVQDWKVFKFDSTATMGKALSLNTIYLCVGGSCGEQHSSSFDITANLGSYYNSNCQESGINVSVINALSGTVNISQSQFGNIAGSATVSGYILTV